MMLLRYILFLVITFLFFSATFTVFFTQDDFLLIYEFTKGNIFQDIVSAFGPPEVTHWRPVHNLFFLVGGNLFGKSYFLFHLINFLFHVFAGILIYKILIKLNIHNNIALFASILYLTNPSHYTTLAWISGSATTIAFVFFLLFFSFYLSKKYLLSTFCFMFSLLASEAFVVAVVVFFLYKLIFEKFSINDKFSRLIVSLTVVFLIVKVFFVAKNNVLGTYKLSLSFDVVNAIKYYIFRIFGFAVGFSREYFSYFAVIVIFATFVKKIKDIKILIRDKYLVFFSLVTIVGLFPFIMFTQHLSAHYMNMSIWGFSVIVSYLIADFKKKYKFLIIFILIFNHFLQIHQVENNNWIVPRSKIAETYIRSIEINSPPQDSTLVFSDNEISNSYEAYVSLGTGKAIDYWFGDKNYKYCFDWFENCNNSQQP